MYQRILVPVDGSAISRCGPREAITLAKSQGGDIRYGRRVLARLVVGWRE